MIYSENTAKMVTDWLRSVVTPHFEQAVKESTVEYEKIFNEKDINHGLAN